MQARVNPRAEREGGAVMSAVTDDARVERERQYVERVARRKARREALEQAPPSYVVEGERAARRYEYAVPPGQLRRQVEDGECPVEDTEWPGYFMSLPEEPISEEVLRLVSPGAPRREVDISAPRLCEDPPSIGEVADYVETSQPETFSWGQRVRRGDTTVAHHATRMPRGPGGILMYRLYTSKLRLTTNQGQYVLVPEARRNTTVDTATRLLRDVYSPGDMLDVSTLLGGMSRREGCINAYKLYDAWLGDTSERNDRATLAYVVGVLTDDPDESWRRLAACDDGDDSTCISSLLDMLQGVRERLV
jgi:hypothetical protein